jgi:hypothetical protein
MSAFTAMAAAAKPCANVILTSGSWGLVILRQKSKRTLCDDQDQTGS